MKITVLYILFFCTISTSAQNKDSLVNAVKRNFERAENELKTVGKELSTYRYHSVIHRLDKYQIDNSATAYLRTISRKKIDSLLPIVLNENFKRVKKGKWKLSQLKDNDNFIYKYKYIEITENEILFYNENLDTPSRIEEIRFPLFEDFYKLSVFKIFESRVKFKNGEIWELVWYGETDGIKSKDFLIPVIIRLEDGTETEQRYGVDTTENRTYYTLIEKY